MSDNGNKGAGDASLMLRIRAEALKGNLDRVKDFLQTAPSRRREIEKLEAELKALQKVATSIDTSLYRAKSVIEDAISGEPAAYSDAELTRRMEELQQNSRDMKTDLESILEMTKDAKAKVAVVIETIADMKRNCFQIQPQEPVGVRLKDDLTGRIKNPTRCWPRCEIRSPKVCRTQAHGRNTG
jgi:DNA repair ATPase RecN